MKVLLIGAEGQLGTELAHVYREADLHKADLVGDAIRLDVCDAARVMTLIRDEIRPDLVINTAAAHDVPRCQEFPDRAYAVNATAVMRLAAACRAAGARLIHLSTDYVFGSGGTRPYVETDLPAPINVYGASKLAGEHLVAAECPNHLIVRTAAMYGTAPCRAKGGRNFVDLMLHLAATRGEVKVVTDETVSPTYAGALARQIELAARKALPGIYHMTCHGECSWYAFARAIFDATGTPVRLLETTSREFQSPVRRPDYSPLENWRLQEQGLDIMPHWQDGLNEYLAAHRAQAPRPAETS